MSKDRPARPKGATNFDIVGMNDEEFERMNARLIRLEHPTAFKPANVSDGGADMLLPGADGSGYKRSWQSKHYPKKIYWDKCEKSLADARKHWNPEHYTFVFPRELTVGEQKTFDEKFGSLDITVDYWNGEELQARLTGSDDGERVARHFFEDPELQREQTYQAIEAGGRLDDAEDAVDRLSNIGAFLAGNDAYFSYPATTHEEGGPAPALTPGAIMSFAKGDGKVRSRVDVVPRDDEAMERYGPEFVLQPSEGEVGERAAERLQEALLEGTEVEIDEGLDITFTRMPPGFDDFVGERLTGGTMKFGRVGPARRPVPPWKAHLRAESGEGQAELTVKLHPVATPPDGWDGALAGEYGGLTVTAMFRQRGDGGELRWNFTYARTRASVGEQLDALRFMRAISAPGELVITDRGGSGRPEIRMATPVEPLGQGHRALVAFLEDVHAIEKFAGVEFELPAQVRGADANRVGVIAEAVRNGGYSGTWDDFEMTVPSDNIEPLREGRVVRWERPVAANVLGRVVDLGYTQVDVAGYVIASEQEAPDQPGYTIVRLEPASPESASVFERLVKKPTNAQRRPPRQVRKKQKRKHGAKHPKSKKRR